MAEPSPQTSTAKSLQWVLILIGVLLFCIPIVVSLFLESNKSGEVKTVQEPAEQPKDVAAEGSLSKSVVILGESAQLWITLRNRSLETISNVTVPQLDIPGFSVDQLCFLGDDGTPKCADRSKVNIPQILSGQTIVIWATAKASEPVEKHMSYAMLGWNSPSAHSSQIVIPLGGNVVQTSLERGLHAFGEFMKDFALPLLVVVLGLSIGRMGEKREEARRAADKKLDDERRALDKKLEDERRAYDAVTQQTHLTWNKMLPVTYQLAVRYYMKIEAAAQGVLDTLGRAHLDPKKLPMCQLSLFYLVLFQRRVKYFTDLNSGFYFKNYDGESLVNFAYERYRRLYFGNDLDIKRAFNRIAAGADLNETVDAFLKKLTGDGEAPAKDFVAVWDHFLKWLPTENCRLAFMQLRIFDLVLRFEINRPFSYWYGWPETLEYWNNSRTALNELATELEKVDTEKDAAGAIRSYVANGEPKPLYPGPLVLPQSTSTNL